MDLLLVRRLPAWSGNTGKRLVKAPKVVVRDSGIVHALLDIPDHHALLGHPVVGGSWEGFVIEQILSVVQELTLASYYRSAAGHEIDLVLEQGRRTIAIEVKRTTAPTLDRAFHVACKDLGVDEAFVVYPGRDTYPLNGGIAVTDIRSLMSRLAATHASVSP